MMEELSLVDESTHKAKGLSVNAKRVIIFGVVFLVVAALFVTILVTATKKSDGGAHTPRHKNLIIMIGDGYGPASVTFGRTCKGSDLYIEKHLKGLVRTKSNESVVTDSAAAATTYSCGIRTYNSAIAVDNNKKPCGTVFEAALRKGMKVGAVVTSRVTHATPAAFTSHAYERDDEEFIAKQQIEMKIDVLMGGGRDMFTNDTRRDHLDLIERAKQNGFTVLNTKSDFDSYTADGPVLGLFDTTHMDYEVDRVRITNASDSRAQPSLADMTRKALDILSKKAKNEGFILLVEGSRIDHGGHDNDPVAHLGDILAFDEAAKVCLEFADKTQDTLIVATADHETGGMTLGYQGAYEDPIKYIWYPEVVKSVNASAEYMAAQIRASPDTLEEIVKQYAWPDVTSAELAFVRQYINNSTQLVWALGKVTSDRAHIGYTTHGHTGVDVDLYVYSPFREHGLPFGAVENYELGLFYAREFGLDLDAVTRDISSFNPH